ncbi:MAG: hypothetical protein M1617_00850 [Actinobacteria bacterium]|nr:hypothetical protein [Actinomycetota bacterium]
MAPDFADAAGEVSRHAVFEALIAYGRELEAQGVAQVGSGFTGRKDPDALLQEDPNAFLLGVLFTQGIPAERAWAGPWELKQRLGTLDLHVLASDPEAVAAAFQTPPMLHRFKNTLPKWISAAAARLLAEWGGDAAAIWPDGTSMAVVSERLSRFDGIGRKKAAMATQILMRHFRVDLAGLESGQVAYDIHVRRVFLRSGLAHEDSLAAIEQAAREGAPESPGVLDIAAWLVGRETCRPRNPDCDRCRLGGPCPRLVSITPRGVGAR